MLIDSILLFMKKSSYIRTIITLVHTRFQKQKYDIIAPKAFNHSIFKPSYQNHIKITPPQTHNYIMFSPG